LLHFLPYNSLKKIYTGSIVNSPNPNIFLSAGEASGDHYGAQIIAQLRKRHPDATFFGLGGREMEAADLDRVIRAEDVAHMGITEVLRHAPRVYNSYRRLVSSIKRRRPDAAILIDFPDVNFRLARELKKLNIPVIYFVSPQLWAWKRSRLRWVQQRVDRMMVIFPFEEKFYRNRNVNATFTGHPLAELPLPASSREDYARAHNLEIVWKQWIVLLPGSRSKELHTNLPEMLKTAKLLAEDRQIPACFLPKWDPNVTYRCSVGAQLFSQKEHLAASFWQFILPVASTLDPAEVQAIIDQHQPLPPIRLVPDAREALHHARASIVASGTATVQAAVIGNPFVVVYKVSALTFRLAKRLVRYPPEIWPSGDLDADGNLPIAMVNLIAGRRVVPELLQERFTAANVAAALRPLLDDTPERTRMIADLADVRQALQPPEKAGSIDQVCDAVDALLSEKPHTGGPNPRTSV
jgi:lipid-A-disaccharide synthase